MSDHDPNNKDCPLYYETYYSEAVGDCTCPPAVDGVDTLDRSSTDAMHWAAECIKTAKEHSIPMDDAEWLMGWFANYWAAIHDPLQAELDKARALITELEAEAGRRQKETTYWRTKFNRVEAFVDWERLHKHEAAIDG